MKLLAMIVKMTTNVWKFITRLSTICVLSAVVLICLIVIMPENAYKAVELLKSIIKR